jgi:hypothetical protein
MPAGGAADSAVFLACDAAAVRVSYEDLSDAVLDAGSGVLTVLSRGGLLATARIAPTAAGATSATGAELVDVATQTRVRGHCVGTTLALHPSATVIAVGCADGRVVTLPVDPATSSIAASGSTANAGFSVATLAYSALGTHLTAVPSSVSSAVKREYRIWEVPSLIGTEEVVIAPARTGASGSWTFDVHAAGTATNTSMVCGIEFPTDTTFVTADLAVQVTDLETNVALPSRAPAEALPQTTTVLLSAAEDDFSGFRRIRVAGVVNSADSLHTASEVRFSCRKARTTDFPLSERWWVAGAAPVTWPGVSTPLPTAPTGSLATLWAASDLVFATSNAPVDTTAIEFVLRDCSDTEAPRLLDGSYAVGARISMCIVQSERVRATPVVLRAVRRLDRSGVDVPCVFAETGLPELSLTIEAHSLVSPVFALSCSETTTAAGDDRFAVAISSPLGHFPPYYSDAFAAVPVVAGSVRVVLGAHTFVGPATLPAGVVFFVDATFSDVPFVPTGLVITASPAGACIISGAPDTVTRTVQPSEFAAASSLIVTVARVMCKYVGGRTPPLISLSVTPAVQGAVFTSSDGVERPVVRVLSTQAGELEPFVFDVASDYSFSVNMSPAAAQSTPVTLYVTRNGVPAVSSPCVFMPSHSHELANVPLRSSSTVRIQCSRPVAASEAIAVSVVIPQSTAQDYSLVTDDVLVAYVPAVSGVAPFNAATVPTLTPFRVFLKLARALHRPTAISFEALTVAVLSTPVKCFFSASRAALLAASASPAAFDAASLAGTFGQSTTQLYPSDGALNLSVFAMCSESLAGTSVRIRYTVLSGTPIRDDTINSGTVTVGLTEKLIVHSDVLPVQRPDDLAASLLWGETARMHVAYSLLPEHAAVSSLYVRSNAAGYCIITSPSAQSAGSSIPGWTQLSLPTTTDDAGSGTHILPHGSIAVSLDCDEPMANVTLTARLDSTVSGSTVLTYTTNAFDFRGLLAATLRSTTVPVTSISTGAGSSIAVPVDSDLLVTIHTTPAVQGADLTAALTSTSGGCSLQTATCRTGATGVCVIVVRCAVPAKKPPTIAVTSSGAYAFAPFETIALRPSGRLTVQSLDAVGGESPYFIAGRMYRLAVGFNPPPVEPQTIVMSQLTTGADCAFSLSLNQSQLVRTATWTHGQLTDALVVGLVCRRSHAVGSIVLFDSAAYYSYNFGPVPTFGVIDFEHRIPANIVGAHRVITDLGAREARTTVSSAPALAKPYYLRAPLTNTTLFRLRTYPAVIARTLINVEFSDPTFGCEFFTSKADGTLQAFGHIAQLNLVLGDIEKAFYVSCVLPRAAPISLIATIASGSPYVAAVSVPMFARGSITLSTQGVFPADRAFGGLVMATRGSAFNIVLSPAPVETTTLAFSAHIEATGAVLACSFASETAAADGAPAGTANSLAYLPTMLQLSVILTCTDMTSQPAIIRISNTEQLYDNFSSAPYRIRGAVWTEDAALERFKAFPGIQSVFRRVAVQNRHPLRLRLLPVLLVVTRVVITTNAAVCSLGLADTVAVSDFTVSLSVTVQPGTAEVPVELYCSALATNVVVTVKPADAASFVDEHATGAFEVRNRYSFPTLPLSLHLQLPTSFALEFLPVDAMSEVGAKSHVSFTLSSDAAECSIARRPSASYPAEYAWFRIGTSSNYTLPIGTTSSIPLWLRCMINTHDSTGAAIPGTAPPTLVASYVTGVPFMTYQTATPLRVTYIDCFVRPEVAHGSTVYEDHGYGATAYLARATTTCKTGHALTSAVDGTTPLCAGGSSSACSHVATCDHTGWSTPPPLCVLQDCGPLPSFDSNTSKPPAQVKTGVDGAATTYGASYSFACNEGFELSSAGGVMTCGTGAWSPSTAPPCVAVQCPALQPGVSTTDPAYSTEPHGEHRFGSVATYQCEDGHSLSQGTLTRTCRSDKTWSGEPPLCRSNSCVNLTPDRRTVRSITFMRNGAPATLNNVTNMYLADTIAQYACAEGHAWVADTSVTMRRCTIGEGWLPASPPRCEPRKCPELQPVQLGSFEQEPAEYANRFGVTASFKCVYGAVIAPAGSGNKIRCTDSGTWSGAPRMCAPFYCGAPGVVANGQQLVFSNGEHGAYYNLSVVEYRCDTGYNLRYPGYEGSNSTAFVSITTGAGADIEVGRRECTPNGYVPAALPVCQMNRCGYIAVDGGVRKIVYSNADALLGPGYGSLASYVCEPGFETRDPRTDAVVGAVRMCGTRAQGWQPVVAPSCGPVDCGMLSETAVVNGEPVAYEWSAAVTTGPTRYRATAAYRCKPGYTLPGGVDIFYRACAADRSWSPAAPTCVDVNECDATANGGKYFVNCSALHGSQSRCINTDGSYICVPVITIAPFTPGAAVPSSSLVMFDASSRELLPRTAAGGQTIRFAMRTGAGLVAPYFTRVRYQNPSVAFYADPALLTYECTDITVQRASEAARTAAGFDYFEVTCKLSAGQGAGLYLSVQYCTRADGATSNAQTDCSRWNWHWSGSDTSADFAFVGSNDNVRVTYPMPAFVPSTLRAITAAGVTEMTNDYVSATSLGENIAMDVDNMYLTRPGLVSVTYGLGPPQDSYPHVCTFDQALASSTGTGQSAVACHTEDNVNKFDLRFRLCVARRCVVSTDRYSYPQVPIVESVYGCPVDNMLTQSTSECPTSGAGVRLSVTGTGFLEPMSVLVSGRQCTALDRVNATYFTCSLPANAGVSLSLIVKAGSQRTEARDRVSYTAPVITGIQGCEQVTATQVRQCNRLGGNRIALTGRHFGAAGAAVLIGGQNCLNVTHDAKFPQERVLCVVPEGTTSERPVTLLQRYGIISVSTILLSYVQCPPGTYSNSSACSPCPPGQFNDVWSQAQCRACAAGTFTAVPGALQCSSCPSGTYSSLGAASCRACPRGTFSQSRAGECTQCALGTFADSEGSALCETCPLGAESTEDFVYCRCKVGSYMSRARTCAECMLGGDCSAAGTNVFNIKSLPDYAPAVVRVALESVRRISIVLPASGTDENARRSVRATLTKYLYDHSDLPRDRIEFVTIALRPATAAITSPSAPSASGLMSPLQLAGATPPAEAALELDVYPSLEANDTETAATLATRVLDALSVSIAADAVSNARVLVNTDYSRQAIQSFEPCINKACSGQNVCQGGHSGHLCTVCLPGYGKTSPFVCAKCNPPALRTFILAASVIAAIVVCGVLVWKQIEDGKQSMNELPAPAIPLLLKVAASGLQVMAIAARYDLKWPGFLGDVFNGADTAGGVGTAFLSLDCFLDENPSIRPFWVTTICIMILPIVGVLLPAAVFFPMYLVRKRAYRAALVAAAVEERALTAEVIAELKVHQKAQRSLDVRRRAAEAGDRGLVWEGVDDAVGLEAVSLDESAFSAAAGSTAPGLVGAGPTGASKQAQQKTQTPMPRAGAMKKRILHSKSRPRPLAPPVAPPAHTGRGAWSDDAILSLAIPSASAGVRASGNHPRSPLNPIVMFHEAQGNARTRSLAQPSVTRGASIGSPSAVEASAASRVFTFGSVSPLPAATPRRGASGSLDISVSAFAARPDDTWRADRDRERERERDRYDSASDSEIAATIHFVGDISDDSESGATDGDGPAHASLVPPMDAAGSQFVSSTVARLTTLKVTAAPFESNDGPSRSANEHTQSFSSGNEFVDDDYAWLMRERLGDGQMEDAWMAAFSSSNGGKGAGVTDVMTHEAWKLLVNEYRLESDVFDDERIKSDARARMAVARTAYELATVVQSAEDLQAVAAVLLETDDVLYDAEVLREHAVRRERAAQRVRSQQQLAWYRETYGDETGDEMFEAARAQRLKATKIRLTLSECRKQVHAAEHAYMRVGSEFVGYVITAITVVMFMIHPNITKQFFMVLSCKSIGGAADPGASFLLGDLTEPCYSSQHVLFILVLGIPMFVFWVLGIPVFAWAILYWNRALIQAPAAGLSDVTLANKKALESQMAFLYRGYKPTRFYWFLMEMSRKVALVAISVFFPGALHTQLMLAALLIFACILAQLALQPFENRIPGTVEFISLGTSFMIFFLANFLFVETISDEAKVAATVLIIVLVLLFFAIVVVAFVVLFRDERSLGPLRAQLREAHVRGFDVKQVIRNWRIERARKISRVSDAVGVSRRGDALPDAVAATAANTARDANLVLDAAPRVQNSFATVQAALRNAGDAPTVATVDDGVEAAYGSAGVTTRQQYNLGPTLDATHVNLASQ